MEKSKIATSTMTRIAIITALFCILAPISIPLPFSPVPISLTNLVVFLSVFVLNWKAATISYILYLLLGLIGLPVFSGFSGGFGKFVGPTGGYLVGMTLLVLIAGLFMSRSKNKNVYVFYIIGTILGEVVLYIFGTAWLSYSLGVSFKEGLFIGVIPYLPGDIIKLLIAMKIGQTVRVALTRYLGKDPIFNDHKE